MRPVPGVLLSFLLPFLSVHADEGSIAPSRVRVFTLDLKPGELVKAKDLRWFPERTEIESMTNADGLRAKLVGETKRNVGGTVAYFFGERSGKAAIDEKTGVFVIRLEGVPATGSIPLSIRIIDSYGKLSAEDILVDLQASEIYRRFSADLGSSVTSLDYSETQGANQVRLREVGLTLKGGIGWRLSPEWDLAANAFLTAIPIPISTDPSGLTAARWYGFNARIGRTLYRSGPSTSLSLSVGEYTWGMLTGAQTGAVYGVNTLGGPQAFLTYRSRSKIGHAWYAYGKFALIQAGGGFRASDHEVALGGGYQPWTRSEATRKWTLTTDLALTETGVFRLASISFGISRALGE